MSKPKSQRMSLSSIKDKIIEHKRESINKSDRKDSGNYFQLIKTDPGHKQEERTTSNSKEQTRSSCPHVRELCVQIIDTWEKSDSLGLKSIEFFNFTGEPIFPLSISVYDSLG